MTLSLARPVAATDYVVDTTSTSTSADGSISLREAILAANSNAAVGDAAAGEADGDTITFDPTVFPEASPRFISTSVGGEILISDDLVISAAGAGVAISGGQRIFNITAGAGESVVLEDLDLFFASAFGADSAINGLGGVIYSGNDTPLTLNRVILRSSSAGISGGGLYHDGGSLSIVDCVINSNIASGSAADNGGGGIYTRPTALTISGTTFQFNSAQGTAGSGGALFISDANGNVEVSITDSDFISNNFRRAGGAIETLTTGSGINLLIDNSRFTNNSFSFGASGNGGAIHTTSANDGDTTLTISQSQFSGNLSGREGGAVWIDAGVNASIRDSRFESNRISEGGAADSGGGALYSNGGNFAISDSFFSGNRPSSGRPSYGGAILVNGGTTTIDDSTLIANTTNQIGGAIYVTNQAADEIADVTIRQSQFSDNLGGVEGGAIWIDSSANVKISDSRFEGNNVTGVGAADSGGGALYSNGGEFTIANSFFSGNSSAAAPSSGGALLINGGTSTISDSTFLGNTTNRAGGAIEVSTVNSDVTLTLTNSSLSGNSASNSPGNGGAIHITDVVGDNSATVTINGGQILGNTASQEGGGLWNDAESVMNLNNVLVQANVAQAANAGADAQGGGGIFNNGGEIVIADSTINGNFAQGDGGTDDGGAGILNDGRNNSGASVTIANSMISNNDALTGLHNGGGILNIGETNTTTTTVTITGSMLKENTAARAGGAIENNNGVVEVTRSVMDLNRAGINGGGVHITADGTLALTDTKVTSNNAVNEGGGLWNSGNALASIALTRVQLSNNSAKDGGAIFNDGADGTITAVNSVISGNNAGRNGGGIDTEGGTVRLNYTTVANNMSETNDDDDSDSDGGEGSGGGINVDSGATVVLDSTVVADNVGNSGTGNDVVSTSAIAASFSVVEDQAGGHGVTNGMSGNIVGVDPQLLVLADNGGTVFTHALEFASVAIDTANAATCPATDARGTTRPVGAGCDIGSYEANAGEVDCNMNSVSDNDDIMSGTSMDCDTNGIPDECQNDADSDGTIDSCEMCPMDADKTEPRMCGCGIDDTDSNNNDIADCQDEDVAFELSETVLRRISRLTLDTPKRRLFGANNLLKLVERLDDAELQLITRRIKALARRIRRQQNDGSLNSSDLRRYKRIAQRRIGSLQDGLQASANSDS